MLLHLVRHTITALPPNICYGNTDVPLANADDITAVVNKLSHLESPVVYSSPLTRCRLLAEQLSEHVIFDNRLKELNFGVWELQSWNNVRGPEADRWMNNFVHERCPGGESFLELTQRAGSFIESITPTEQPIIIVSHAGIIRAVAAMLQHIPFEKCFDIQVGYGDVLSIPLVLNQV